jgi:hypothetical protein
MGIVVQIPKEQAISNAKLYAAANPDIDAIYCLGYDPKRYENTGAPPEKVFLPLT